MFIDSKASTRRKRFKGVSHGTKPKVDIGTTTDYENICKNMYNKAEIVDTSVRKSGRTRMLKVEDRERRLWKEERPQSF